MTYRGVFKSGVVVLEGDVNLPDGTAVDVVMPESAPIPGQEQQPTVWDQLLEIAGTAEGLPEDASVNVDHYLYGLPKK